MEKRHILLIVALLSAIVFVMPSIYSLFAGQHWFYDTGVSYCLKCHSDIKQELDSQFHHTFTCENCHTVNTNSNATHGNVVLPRCLDCHSNPGRIVTDSNGNTFLTPLANVFGENVTNAESHNPFIAGANSSPLMKGENEACVSCHTRKSVSINIRYADTYTLNSRRVNDGTWQIWNYSKNAENSANLNIQSSESSGKHLFLSLNQLKCEKCHPNIEEDLTNSSHHISFSCISCHQLYSTYHVSSIPPCLECHGTEPNMVTDVKKNTYVASVAQVYAENPTGADAHIPFVLSANSSNLSAGSNIACSSCHSGLNNNIIFSRPEYIEWDVENSGGTWTVQNLALGETKEVKVTKYLDGKSHNISMETGCISCHDDIKQAVSNGGHSNEQWGMKHNYTGYSDMNVYCRSCHDPFTKDNLNNSPYPAYPFNSINHGSIKISCMDCHGRPGSFSVNFNGIMKTPPYNSTSMGSIETSISLQPDFIQSYLCIACKNTGNPVPNTSLHFKLYTEPEVKVYVNGTQQYPK